ncbi:MAG: hypothetical protein LQ340_005310 [Diploschistes diacapsis]|nr:MAG: hypothetical protein LQ340_005310 [Diploschistes diacapsis]
MPTNWKDPDTNEKLMAAMVAAQINYHAIARYFGDGTTYSAVENRFRRVRKMAEEMRAAVDRGQATPIVDRVRPAASYRVQPNPNGSSSGDNVQAAKGNGQASTGTKRSGTGQKKQKTSATGDAVISGRVSKSKSKSITPTANRKKAVTDTIKNAVKDEFIGSEEEAMIMEKDSNDEAFSLSEFEGNIEDLDMIGDI